MHRNIFSPHLPTLGSDTLSTFFLRAAQVVFGGVMVLLPLWFLPETYLALGFTKTMFAIVGVYLALLCACLALLRSGKVALRIPLPLLFFWLFALGTLLAAYLSGDVFDGVYGVSLEVFTAAFTLLLAVVMTLGLLFVGDKVRVQNLLWSSVGVLIGVYVFTVVRLVGGAQLLSFGIFTADTETIVGSLNDLALYAGLVLAVALVAIHRLPSVLWLQILTALLIVSSLGILAIVNFSLLWTVFGLLSLVTFLFLIARDTWLRTDRETGSVVSRFSLSMVALICVVSGIFVVSGDYLGQRINAVTGLGYIEVKPSVTATADIAARVYQENALWGAGANRFEDAWRLFKNPVINETQFWNTNFLSGSSYIFTVAITTGLLGIIFLAGFMVTLLTSLYRMFFLSRPTPSDPTWQTIGMIAFAASVYLWGVAFWYTPGQGMMLLAAFFTGLAIVAAESVKTGQVRTVNVAYSRQHGLLLVAAVLFLIVGSTVSFINLNQNYLAQKELATGFREFTQSGNLVAYDSSLGRVAEALPEQDLYPAERARLRLMELNRLIALAEPTDSDRQQFEQLLVEAVQFTETAIALDQTAAFNYALLGTLYGFVNASEVEGLLEKREAAFAKAAELDPKNPEYAVVQAQIASRYGDNATARVKLAEAVQLKRDYTDALFLLSQLDIQEGNATSAIATTRSIITIEPNNPARRFQLGLLHLAIGETEEAQQAFSDALVLDPSHANARYMRALTYLDTGRPDEALSEFRIIAETNQDNENLMALIAQIEGGDYTAPQVGNGMPITRSATAPSGEVPVIDDASAEETPLVTPVNRTPANDLDESNNSVPTTEAGVDTGAAE